jgi:hypothetical protein
MRADAQPAPADAAAADTAVEVGLADADAPSDTAVAPEVAVDTAPPSMMPPPPPPPCMATVALPAPSRRLPNGPRGDDFTFAPSGHLVGFDGRNLVRWARPGGLELLASNVIGMRGGALRALANGELLVADFERDAVSLRDSDGQLRRQGLQVDEPMKMVLGPGGAYVTSQDGRISRIDASGAVTPVGVASFDIGGLTFIDDYRTLVVGGLSVDGLHAFDVRADGTLGPPRLWRGQIARAQALATDACNNVYVISEQDSRIRRVGPGMALATVADVRATNLWALAFGSGQLGWSQTALYVEEANTGGVHEVELGVGGQAAPSSP